MNIQKPANILPGFLWPCSGLCGDPLVMCRGRLIGANPEPSKVSPLYRALAATVRLHALAMHFGDEPETNLVCNDNTIRAMYKLLLYKCRVRATPASVSNLLRVR